MSTLTISSEHEDLIPDEGYDTGSESSVGVISEDIEYETPQLPNMNPDGSQSFNDSEISNITEQYALSEPYISSDLSPLTHSLDIGDNHSVNKMVNLFINQCYPGDNIPPLGKRDVEEFVRLYNKFIPQLYDQITTLKYLQKSLLDVDTSEDNSFDSISSTKLASNIQELLQELTFEKLTAGVCAVRQPNDEFTGELEVYRSPEQGIAKMSSEVFDKIKKIYENLNLNLSNITTKATNGILNILHQINVDKINPYYGPFLQLVEDKTRSIELFIFLYTLSKLTRGEKNVMIRSIASDVSPGRVGKNIAMINSVIPGEPLTSTDHTKQLEDKLADILNNLNDSTMKEVKRNVLKEYKKLVEGDNVEGYIPSNVQVLKETIDEIERKLKNGEEILIDDIVMKVKADLINDLKKKVFNTTQKEFLKLLDDYISKLDVAISSQSEEKSKENQKKKNFVEILRMFVENLKKNYSIRDQNVPMNDLALEMCIDFIQSLSTSIKDQRIETETGNFSFEIESCKTSMKQCENELGKEKERVKQLEKDLDNVNKLLRECKNALPDPLKSKLSECESKVEEDKKKIDQLIKEKEELLKRLKKELDQNVLEEDVYEKLNEKEELLRNRIDEIELMKEKIRNLEERLKEKDNVDDELNRIRQEVKEKEKEIETLKTKLEDKNNDFQKDELQQRLNDQEQQLKDKNKELEYLREQTKHYEGYDDSLNKLKEDIKKNSQMIEEYREEINKLRKQIIENDEKNKDLQEELAMKDQLIEKLQSGNQDKVAEVCSTRNLDDILSELKATGEKRLSEMKRTLEAPEKEMEENKKALRDENDDSTKSKISEMISKLGEELRKRNQEISDQKRNHKAEIDRITIELENYKNLSGEKDLLEDKIRELSRFKEQCSQKNKGFSDKIHELEAGLQLCEVRNQEELNQKNKQIEDLEQKIEELKKKQKPIELKPIEDLLNAKKSETKELLKSLKDQVKEITKKINEDKGLIPIRAYLASKKKESINFKKYSPDVERDFDRFRLENPSMVKEYELLKNEGDGRKWRRDEISQDDFDDFKSDISHILPDDNLWIRELYYNLKGIGKMYLFIKPVNPKNEDPNRNVVELDDDRKKVRIIPYSDPNKANIPFCSNSFEGIFVGEDETGKIYKNEISDMVNLIKNGTNILLLAYGQTGSGKTFRLLGDMNDSSKKGILGCFMDDINTNENIYGNYKISIIQSYEKKICDIIGADPIVKKTDKNTKFNYRGFDYNTINRPENSIKKIDKNNFKEKYLKAELTGSNILKYLTDRRMARTTPWNPDSSRSHAFIIFSFNVNGKSSNVVFGDLGGNETWNTYIMPGVDKTTQICVEAATIVQNLTALVQDYIPRHIGKTPKQNDEKTGFMAIINTFLSFKPTPVIDIFVEGHNNKTKAKLMFFFNVRGYYYSKDEEKNKIIYETSKGTIKFFDEIKT
uniref:Kinesin motor domain-containing protein n=1 Tax=viral metagenome TaxID=1070528 RepID=A0A6C0JV05_9ZZZZ